MKRPYFLKAKSKSHKSTHNFYEGEGNLFQRKRPFFSNKRVPLLKVNALVAKCKYNFLKESTILSKSKGDFF